ncbi:MAG: sn-glycerol-3-phosphate ABC transporter ATP-binding protein UgpC [Steroidobacteraceae bacterium]
MAQVELDRVRKVYDNGHVAVADATFTAGSGELLALVGPSGCGKSTLLRLLAGLEQPSAGRIRIGERDVTTLAPKDRDIAMVFQSYALYPHMSVAENMGFALQLRGESRSLIRQRVEEAARMLELSAVLERRPRQLSGGQRQRVALGRALVRNPQVFLLDEPLSNLDAKLRHGMRAEIARLHRRLKTTMVYVTHDQIEAMTLSQRIVVLKAGAIQQIDAPMVLYNHPANVFVAGFLGSPAMNLFHGRYVASPAPHLQCQDQRFLLPQGTPLAQLFEGREYIAGLRPEDLHLQPPATGSDAPGHAQLQTTLESVEPVGNETFLTVRFAGAERVLRTAAQSLPEPGAPLTLFYGSAHLHLFDAGTGVSVGSQRHPGA